MPRSSAAATWLPLRSRASATSRADTARCSTWAPARDSPCFIFMCICLVGVRWLGLRGRGGCGLRLPGFWLLYQITAHREPGYWEMKADEPLRTRSCTKSFVLQVSFALVGADVRRDGRPKPDSRSLKPALLHCRILFFRRAVAAQQLGEVLRERGAGQDHIASHFVGLLLEVSLHVREEADDRSSLFQFALEFGNERERLYVVVIQVEDDQRGFFFAVLLHAFDQVFVALHELDLDVHLARRFLNLGGKEQVVDEGKNSGVGVLPPRYGLRFRRRIGRAEAGPLTSGLLPVVAS